MRLSRSIAVLFLSSQLTACFQVELLGPVSGASVSITPLRGGTPVYSNLKSSDAAHHRDDLGAAAWSDFSPFIQLLHLGTVDVEKSAFKRYRLYLVSARGGRDMDSDSNRKIDSVGSPVEGELHAIMTGAQLKNTSSRVTLLTEAFYRSIQADLGELSNSEILAKLDQMAVRTVSDLNDDGVVDYSDALRWSNITRADTYKGPEFFCSAWHSPFPWIWTKVLFRM